MPSKSLNNLPPRASKSISMTSTKNSWRQTWKEATQTAFAARMNSRRRKLYFASCKISKSHSFTSRITRSQKSILGSSTLAQFLLRVQMKVKQAWLRSNFKKKRQRLLKPLRQAISTFASNNLWQPKTNLLTWFESDHKFYTSRATGLINQIQAWNSCAKKICVTYSLKQKMVMANWLASESSAKFWSKQRPKLS